MSCSIKRILTIETPVKYRTLRVMFDSLDVTNSCSYSWSSDRLCWTNWVDFTTYNTIAKNIEGDYYLRILLTTGFTDLIYDGSKIECYNICLFNTNPYAEDLCGITAFDPYSGLDCALQMYQWMSDWICCTVGIPVYYFRVTPEPASADLTFKEYVLHSISDMKYIKLLVPDGQMPSSRPQMTEFDFDWQNDWEVEIGKDMFAKAFGDTTFPKQRDIIYVPLMNRMYEVNAAYDEKQEGFMWRAMTWKVALVKWNEKTNIDQEEFEEIIDAWAINRIDDILPQERVEQERVSGTTQTEAPEFAATNLINIFMEDAIRKSVTDTEKENITDYQINHGSAIVARGFYDFKDENSMVTYQKHWCGDNGTLSLIIKAYKPSQKKTIFKAGWIEITIDESLNIDFGGMKNTLDEGEIYMIVCNWNRQTFSQSLNIYKYICSAPDDTPIYKIRPEMYRFDFNNPIATLTTAYNNDYAIDSPQEIYISPAPCKVTNIKLYDIVLDDEKILRESIKYTTSDKHCVFNDVARAIESSHGYSVR